MICEQCKKIITGVYVVCNSVEKEDKGREFYVHKICFDKNYTKEGMQN